MPKTFYKRISLLLICNLCSVCQAKVFLVKDSINYFILKFSSLIDANDNEVIKTTGLIETIKRYDKDNRIIRIRNEEKLTGNLIDEYSYRYDSNKFKVYFLILHLYLLMF